MTIRLPLRLARGLGILAVLGRLGLAAAQQPAGPAPVPGTNGLTQTLTGLVEAVVPGLRDTNAPAPGTVELLKGNGLDAFYTWLNGAGVFVDPHGVFSFREGQLHITGERVGYLATRQEFSDYRLIAEYRWGEARFGDRATKPRNSGLIIHGTGLDREWMKGLECQIAEGDTGSLVVHGGAKASTRIGALTKPWSTLPRQTDREVEFGRGKWNTLEVIAQGGRVRVLVNGHVTAEALEVMPSRGKILLQSNGAEIFFRRLDIVPLAPGFQFFTNTPPAQPAPVPPPATPVPAAP